MNRQKTVLLVAVAAGLFLLLLALRPKPAPEIKLTDPYATDHQEVEEEDSRGRSSRGTTRIGRLSASEQDRDPGTTGAVRITRVQRGEDFEAQKERAFGDSRIHGYVRGQDGQILIGAQVELYENDPMTENPPLRTAMTDAEGSYTLSQLNDSDRNYILVARAEGHAPEAQRVNLPRRPMRVDVKLGVGVPFAGVVRDAYTSAGIAGATVYLPTRNREIFVPLGKVETGPGGEFTFAGVQKGALTAQAAAVGYRRTQQMVAAPATDAEIAMIPGGAVIRGVTLSRTTNKPVGGSKVAAETGGILMTSLAKEDGTFEFADLPGGKYQLFALRGGIRSAETKLELGETETKEDVKIVVPDDLFVSGRVELAGSGEAIPGVQVWFKGPRGTQAAMSDDQGRFAFETMALDEYTLEVHEKQLLPVQDKKTSAAVEIIRRKVPPGASSDEVVIKLHSTSAIVGVVKAAKGNGKSDARIWGADVVVDYKTKDFYERVHTRTDTKGAFFVNLPNRRPADVRVSASHRGFVAVENARAPTKKPIELQLKQTYLRGKLVLSDSSPLSGVRIKTKNFLYADKTPDKNFPLPGTTVYTGEGGGFFMPVGANQHIEVTFEMPDERQITKSYETSKLVSKRFTFIYDPVRGDVLTDVDRGSAAKSNGQQKTGQQKTEQKQTAEQKQAKKTQNAGTAQKKTGQKQSAQLGK